MAYAGETAYITGGASGIARFLATDLVSKGMKVFIADRDGEGVKKVAQELNANTNEKAAWGVQVDVADWESQRKGIDAAVSTLGHIDYVFPIAGITEQPWIPKDLLKEGPFVKPNLKVLDVNGYGAIYSASLAIEQFRRQEPNKYGFRGKICTVSSACGFYYIPALPIYTASKHAVVGFTRSFGKYLPREKITLNTICPNIVATNISTGSFYQQARERGLLIAVESLIHAFEFVMGHSDISGEAIEVLPGNDGYRIKEIAPFTNDKVEESIEIARAPGHRAWKFHEPVEA